MNNIVNALLELTKGKVRGDIETLKDFVVDGKFTPFQELINDCDNFYFNGQELVIYKGNKIKYSANITEYCEQYFVTTMYDYNSKLVYENEFDYDSELNLCLLDLYDLKKKYPSNWIYNLDNIYNKYGIDTVNTARDLFGYNML